MLTYQVRPRVFRIAGTHTLAFPAYVEISFHYRPLQAFGMSASGGSTIIRASTPRILLNLNTGQSDVVMNPSLSPLSVTIEDGEQRVHVKGNQLVVARRFETFADLAQFIEGTYFGLKFLLALDFSDPPIVERVEGKIGDIQFGWELLEWEVASHTTTQELQEARFRTAWERLNVVGTNRRLLGAACYFHTACRLRREAKWPGEFLAEALLNFCKALEVVYGDRDTVREWLPLLGYTAEEIERDYMPAMLLRNSMDVGHPMLAVFTSDELQTLQEYADQAEKVFRDWLQRLFRLFESDPGILPEYELGPADPATRKTIATMRDRLAALKNKA